MGPVRPEARMTRDHRRHIDPRPAIRAGFVANVLAALATAVLPGACAPGHAPAKPVADHRLDAARDRCVRMGFTPAAADFALCVEAERARIEPPAGPGTP
jgi:hypothetical protein